MIPLLTFLLGLPIGGLLALQGRLWLLRQAVRWQREAAELSASTSPRQSGSSVWRMTSGTSWSSTFGLRWTRCPGQNDEGPGRR
jgi:hypothetical protein